MILLIRNTISADSFNTFHIVQFRSFVNSITLVVSLSISIILHCLLSTHTHALVLLIKYLCDLLFEFFIWLHSAFYLFAVSFFSLTFDHLSAEWLCVYVSSFFLYKRAQTHTHTHTIGPYRNRYYLLIFFWCYFISLCPTFLSLLLVVVYFLKWKWLLCMKLCHTHTHNHTY